MPRTLTWTPDQDLRQRKKQGNQQPSSQAQRPRGSRPTAPPAKRSPRTGTSSKPPVRGAAPKGSRREAKPKENRQNIAELYILKQIREKTPMVIHSYNGVEYGVFTKLSKYHLTTLVDEKKKGNEKLELSCFYKQRDEEAVHQVMRHSEQIASEDLTPVRPRKDRFDVPSDQLAQYRRDSVPVRVFLRTGEVFEGEVQWFTPFDLGLMLPAKVKVMIFRHAIHRFEVIGPSS